MLRIESRMPSAHHWMRALLAAFSISLATPAFIPVWAEEVDPTRFEKVEIATKLMQPMEMALAPDGSLFLIELAGDLKRIDPKTRNIEVVGHLEVTTQQENGLIGMCLDPAFAENGWIYLQYSPPDYSGQYISRFDFRDGKLDLASEKRLFQYEEQRRECCHHAGSMEFGPDGCLYIGTGDNTNPFNDSQGFAPIDQRPGREPWDAQRTSANTRSYNGKILRIRPTPEGSYEIPEGNLFPKDGSVGHPEIYVMGCRNPWRLNLDRRTGYLYWGDVGPDAGGDGERGPRGYDEVNQARQAGFFGWPYFIGPNRPYSMVDFATGAIHPPQDAQQPVNASVNNTGARNLPPAQPPLLYYPAGPIEEFPEVGSGGRTACAGPVYYFDDYPNSPTKLPRAYDRTLFAFEWSRNWIVAVHLDEDHRIERLERFLPEVPFIRPVDLQFDANGSLYVIEYGETWGVNADARLVRIDYQRGNRTPVAVSRAENQIGREPLAVRLSAEGSSDRDQDPLTYRWFAVATGDPNNTAPVAIGQGVEIEHLFTQPGTYSVILEAADPRGAVASTSLPVVVGNAVPKVSLLEPADGDFYEPGQPIAFRVRVEDPEDGSNDFEAVEAGDAEAIEGKAPSRTTIELFPETTGLAANEPPGLQAIRKSDCLNCHAIDRALVGPRFLDIAEKYRDQEGALEKSIQRVREGSTGVWGKVAMLPHAQLTEQQVDEMVRYIYQLKPDASRVSAQGFQGNLNAPASGSLLRLQATYTDLGREGNIPALSGTTSVLLRGRRIQAESADAFAKTQPLASDNAEGKKFLGAIDNGATILLRGIPLERVSALKVRVASAGAGGAIEVHQDSVDGPLLGKIDVAVNGQWEVFREEKIPLQPAQGRHDLVLKFTHPSAGGGLMNIDAIELLPPATP